MRIVVQRVKKASVAVDDAVKASIENGLLLLVGVDNQDTPETVEYMAGKICKLRIFEDDQGKMNLDVSQAGGQVLSVSQFTLFGNTSKGNRPGFEDAAQPDKAQKLWERFNEHVSGYGITLEKGEFGAHMEVSLVNDGPVTFVIDSKK